MGKVGMAIAGVFTSALVGGGAYAGEIITDRMARDDRVECATDYENPELRQECIDDVNATFNKNEGLQVLQIIGVAGIILCGAAGYRALSDEVERPSVRSTSDTDDSYYVP